MAKQANKMVSDMEDASKNLKASVEKAGNQLRTGVDKGKNAVKDHPVAALGVALGATFAAGAIAGARAHQKFAKKQRGKAA